MVRLRTSLATERSHRLLLFSLCLSSRGRLCSKGVQGWGIGPGGLMAGCDRKGAWLGLRFALCMVCTAVLVLPLPSVWAVNAIEHELEIAYTEKLSLSASDVDRILGDAATMLQSQDSSKDVACPVALKRK